MGLGEIIDIPDSGAVFTLGKSYLSENHQSYFFIKNDAIRRLICGRNQSAVVCESGRVFVWGENQCGQLGIGAADIVTKPSCVKAIKALGERVRNVAFGEAFTVILTETSKLFYSGRNIFDGEPAFAGRFSRTLPSAPHDAVADAPPLLVCRKPFELADFAALLLDADGNVGGAHFVDVAAGDEHFVVLTGDGKLYGWGSNAYSQLGGIGVRNKPTLLSAEEHVRVVSCGRKSTAFITANNAVFILGTSGELQFVALMPINTSSFEELMYSIYSSPEDGDPIYLVITSGEIFRSAPRDGQLHFEPHNVISENIRKICTGAGFVAIVTETNKLLTTFRERSSSGYDGRLRSPRELRKFSRLEVVDAVCGEHHILVHGLQPSAAANAAVLSSSSNDEADADTVITAAMNDLNRTYGATRSGGQAMAEVNGPPAGGDSLIRTLRRCLTMKDSRNILSSKIPVFDSRRLSQETMPPSLEEFEAAEAAEREREEVEEEVAAVPVVKSTSLNDFETLEAQEEGIREERVTNNDEIADKDAIMMNTSTPTSASSMKSLAQTVIHRTPANLNVEDLNNNSMSDATEENATEQNTSEENAIAEDDDDTNDQKHPAPAILDEQPPDGMNSSTPHSDRIHFIDNGKSLSPSTTIDTESATEPVGSVASGEEPTTATITKEEELENTFLGEKLLGATDQHEHAVANVKEETKNAVRVAVDGENGGDDQKQKGGTGIPGNPFANDADSLQRRVSIGSYPSTKNPFETVGQAEVADQQPDGLVAVENGRMKRFIRDMRSKGKGISCRNADSVAVEDDVVKTTADEQLAVMEHGIDDKTSKVCTIL